MNINHCFLSSSGLFYYKIPLVLPLLWLSAWLLAPKGIFGRAKSLNLPVVQAGCWLAGERTKEMRLSRGRGDTYCAVPLCNIGALASDSAYQMCPWLQSTVGIPTSGPQQANGLFLLSWKGSLSGSFFVFLSEINLVKKGSWVGRISNSKAVLCREEKCLAYFCFWWHKAGSTMLCFVWYK